MAACLCGSTAIFRISLPCSSRYSRNRNSYVKVSNQLVTADGNESISEQNASGLSFARSYPQSGIGRRVGRSNSGGHITELLKLVKDNQNGDLQLALDNWTEPLSSRDIVSVINNVSKWEAALEFFRWAKAHEDLCDVTVYCYNVMLKSLRNGKQWTISEDIVRDMMKNNIVPDTYTFTTLLGCAKRCNRSEGAIEWFHKMTEAGVVFDEVAYSSLIDLFGRAGKASEAIALFNTLRSKEWKPDLITLGTMANVYAKLGDYQAITKMFKDMETLQIRPNVVLFNILIGALSKAGKTTIAKNMYKEMSEVYGVEPTAVTMSIIIDMYANLGDSTEAFKLYNDIREKKLKCDVPVYNTLIKSCVATGNVEGGIEIMEEMQRVGCVPDGMTYGAMMNVFATKGMVDEAKSMLEKMDRVNYPPDTRYFTILIRACKQGLKYDRIPAIFNQMMTRGCIPDDKLNGMLLSCVTSRSIDEAGREGVLGCVRMGNPRLYLVLSALSTEGANGDDIVEQVEEYVSKYVTVTSRKPICNALIDYCWVLDMKEMAHKLLVSGISSGIYNGLEMKLSTLWQLNLRSLSMSAAECALHGWIKKLWLANREGEVLADNMVVETGVGRSREGSERLSDMVRDVLVKQMHSPFVSFGSYFTASRDDVKVWLSDDGGADDDDDDDAGSTDSVTVGGSS